MCAFICKYVQGRLCLHQQTRSVQHYAPRFVQLVPTLHSFCAILERRCGGFTLIYIVVQIFGWSTEGATYKKRCCVSGYNQVCNPLVRKVR